MAIRAPLISLSLRCSIAERAVPALVPRKNSNIRKTAMSIGMYITYAPRAAIGIAKKNPSGKKI